jgi:hypothetical protein
VPIPPPPMPFIPGELVRILDTPEAGTVRVVSIDTDPLGVATKVYMTALSGRGMYTRPPRLVERAPVR